MSALDHSFAIGPLGMSLNLLLLYFAIAIALIVGGVVGRRYRTGINDALLTAMLVAVAVARLVFVVRYYDDYSSVQAMMDIRDGGFDILGGLISGVIYLAWWLWRTPGKRTPLVSAVSAGLITWVVTAGSLNFLENTVRQLPQTSLWTLDGNPAALDQFAMQKGKPMVINLWASWCPPCRREMPVFQAAQQEQDDITFVFVNQGEIRETVEQFMAAESLELENVLLDHRMTLGKETGAMAMPTTFYYDAQGQLVDTHLGELSSATLKRGLEKLR